MHVLLGILGSIVTILYMLDRLGLDLGGLNPWSWRRRRNWRNRFEGDPIYSIEDPIQIAALLVVGAARLDGELTSEQKQAALGQFKSVFSVGERAASELVASASHLLKSPQLVATQLDGLVERNRSRFSEEQARSVIDMALAVGAAGGALSGEQSDYLRKLGALLPEPATRGGGAWA